MKLSDIVCLKADSQDISNGKTVSAETDFFGLTDAQFSRLPETLLVEDAHNRATAFVTKGFLKYLRNTCSAAQLIAMLERVPVGMVAIDSESRIFFINDAYTRILGVPRHRVLGQYMATLEPNAVILNVLNGNEETYNGTVWINSVKRHVRVNIDKLEKDGEPWGAISFFIDETEKKMLTLELNRAKGLVTHFQKELETRLMLPKGFNAINTHNAQYLDILRMASLIAQTETSVLIQGEHGVGKEVLAHAIHQASPRRERPFITVNCAAVPESLLESELFGYEEGSFTGAKRGGALGKFELADKGILFLDEIGDMPTTMQAKLLRALQQGEIEKIGRRKTISVDVRIVAATNKNLEQMVRDGSFRADLFYRLNIAPLNIPPLRERADDIEALAKEFLVKLNEKYHKKVTISLPVYSALKQHSWPGNVRELANTLEYAVIMCSSSRLLPEHLPSHFSGVPLPEITNQTYIPFDRSWKETMRDVEKRLIQNALDKYHGNRSEAIRQLGIGRKAFYSKLKIYGLLS
ncbi:hypothetical protein FACS1894158_17100 [Betaproteobacteria bacterium]|nr:hypothetical protein FACS1894158_17100 [Betaproteobacteria bacterium]